MEMSLSERQTLIGLAHQHFKSLPDELGRPRTFKKGVLQHVLSKSIWARTQQEFIEMVDDAFYEMQNKNYGLLMPWGIYVDFRLPNTIQSDISRNTV